jgi:hypothetical protein
VVATTVVVNVLETPIEHMFHRGEIDERLRSAAAAFRSWCENLCSSSGTVDPSRPVVDVSGNKYHMPERSADAALNLSQMQRRLGDMDYDMMCRVVGVGQSFRDVAKVWYANVPDDESSSAFLECRRHVARRVKDALNVVADVLQLPRKPLAGARPGRIRFYRAFSGMSA